MVFMFYFNFCQKSDCKESNHVPAPAQGNSRIFCGRHHLIKLKSRWRCRLSFSCGDSVSNFTEAPDCGMAMTLIREPPLDVRHTPITLSIRDGREQHIGEIN